MESQKKSNGALVGSIIIIIILILGGIYFWKNSLKSRIETKSNDLGVTTPKDTEGLLEAEVTNMDLEGLDSGI